MLGIYQVVSPGLTELAVKHLIAFFAAIFTPIASPFLLSAQSRPKRSLPRPSLQGFALGANLAPKSEYERYSWESRSMPELCKARDYICSLSFFLFELSISSPMVLRRVFVEEFLVGTIALKKNKSPRLIVTSTLGFYL